MRLYLVLLSLLVLCSCGVEISNEGGAEQPKTLENFVKIETTGSYTFLANSANSVGGESVDIVQQYYICKYAVTNREWAEYVAAAEVSAPKYWIGGVYPSERADHPVLWVSYDEAVEYCRWLSSKSDEWTFRLPTQAEWEYAAAAENRTHFPWGNNTEATFEDGVLHTKMNYNAVVAAEVLKNPDRLATYNHERSIRYGECDKLSDIISITAAGAVRGWVDHISVH